MLAKLVVVAGATVLAVIPDRKNKLYNVTSVDPSNVVSSKLKNAMRAKYNPFNSAPDNAPATIPP